MILIQILLHFLVNIFSFVINLGKPHTSELAMYWTFYKKLQYKTNTSHVFPVLN